MVSVVKQLGLILFVATLATLMFTLRSAGYNGTPALLIALSIGAAVIIGLTWIHRWYPANLTKRIDADVPIKWSIWIDSREVGTITDAQYATMQLQAVRDRHNALAQVQNLGSVSFIVLERLLIGVPMMFFWGFIALALWSPEFFTAVVYGLMHGDVASNLSFIRFLLLLTIWFCLVSFFLLSLLGADFGFVNHYSEAVLRKLHEDYNIPDEGIIYLTRVVHNDVPATATSN